jgi:hypothetical protein
LAVSNCHVELGAGERPHPRAQQPWTVGIDADVDGAMAVALVDNNGTVWRTAEFTDQS